MAIHRHPPPTHTHTANCKSNKHFYIKYQKLRPLTKELKLHFDPRTQTKTRPLPPRQTHPTWLRPFAQLQNILFNNSGPTAQLCTMAEFTLRKTLLGYFLSPSASPPQSSLILTSPFFLSSFLSLSPVGGPRALPLSLPTFLRRSHSLPPCPSRSVYFFSS